MTYLAIYKAAANSDSFYERSQILFMRIHKNFLNDGLRLPPSHCAHF